MSLAGVLVAMAAIAQTTMPDAPPEPPPLLHVAIGFPGGSAQMSSAARAELMTVARWHGAARMALCVETSGSDAVEPLSPAVLAAARARAVVEALIAAGADEKRLDYHHSPPRTVDGVPADAVVLRPVARFCESPPEEGKLRRRSDY